MELPKTDETLDQVRKIQSELNDYFSSLAQEEYLLHRNGAGEKACLLLRALRSAIVVWEFAENHKCKEKEQP